MNRYDEIISKLRSLDIDYLIERTISEPSGDKIELADLRVCMAEGDSDIAVHLPVLVRIRADGHCIMSVLSDTRAGVESKINELCAGLVYLAVKMDVQSAGVGWEQHMHEDHPSRAWLESLVHAGTTPEGVAA